MALVPSPRKQRTTPAGANVGAGAEPWGSGRCFSVYPGQSWIWARARGIQRWTWPLKVNESRMDYERSRSRWDIRIDECLSVLVVVPRAMESEMFDLRAVISTEVPFTTRGCMRHRSGRSSPPEASGARAQCERGLLIVIRPSRPSQCLDTP